MRNCLSSNQRTASGPTDRQAGSCLNLHGYTPINFRKVQKSGFRIGAYVDLGMKDFEARMTFGKNNINEIQFSENNNNLKLLKSLENEDREADRRSANNRSKEKDKIISTLVGELNKKDQVSNETQSQ